MPWVALALGHTLISRASLFRCCLEVPRHSTIAVSTLWTTQPSSEVLFCCPLQPQVPFFVACALPDSFQSWFLVAQLHVWFCLVRLKREGSSGRLVSRNLVSLFWYDVEQRMTMLGVRPREQEGARVMTSAVCCKVHSSSVKYKSRRELVQEFNGLILAYEEVGR